MRQHHDFRLNEALLHSSFKEKHLVVHRVRNSILRSVITEPCRKESDIQNQNYQKYLKLNPIYKDELTVILRCICNNPERTTYNKNVIKRIMIEYFDDEIMGHIKSDNLFENIKLMECKKGTEIQPKGQIRHFYFVLKGKLLFRNGKISSKIKGRECYGHEQILFKERIQSIQVLTDSVIFSIEQGIFNESLRYLYENKFKNNLGRLRKHPCFQNIDNFLVKRVLLKLKLHQFKEGDVISQEGQQIQNVYFLAKGKLEAGDKNINKIKGVGLKEVSECEGIFYQSVEAATNCEMYVLPVSFFKKTSYLEWLRDTLPQQSKLIQMNLHSIQSINNDKKSTFKVRKTSMSMKKPVKREKSQRPQTQCISYQNQFLFLNQQKPKTNKKRLSVMLY